MHGGIGRSINSIEQIEELQRPLTMEDGGIVLMDLLWSDPTTNDAVEGVQPSPRGPGLVTFGPDRVMEFCRVRRPAACLPSPEQMGGDGPETQGQTKGYGLYAQQQFDTAPAASLLSCLAANPCPPCPTLLRRARPAPPAEQ